MNTAGDLASWEDEEAGEDLAGAGVGDDTGVSAELQWDFIPDVQLHDRWARGDQEALRGVTQRHLNLILLHQLQTHLQHIEHERTRLISVSNYWIQNQSVEAEMTLLPTSSWTDKVLLKSNSSPNYKLYSQLHPQLTEVMS